MLGLSIALKPPALSEQCQPQDMEFKVNTYTADYQALPAIAMDADGDFVIAWTSGGQDGSYDGIYAQRYNAAGDPQGSEFKVNTYTTSNQLFPAIAMDADGDFVIAWQSLGQDGSDYGIYSQGYACPDPIPTLSQWGVILLGLLMGIFGVVGIKQRKGVGV